MQQPSSSSGAEPGPAYAGVVLAGPVASGKRTVAFALASLRWSYAPFPALTLARQSPIHGSGPLRGIWTS